MNWRRLAAEYGTMFLIWGCLILLFSLLSDRFMTAATFSTLASQIPALAVVAAGMTLVIIVAGIDLSVGSMLAFAGAVFGAVLVDAGWPIYIAVVMALGAGALGGFANGWISVKFNVPPFIVTLGMLEIARGLSYMTTRSQTKYLDGALSGLATPVPGIGLPPSFFIAIAVVVILQFVLSGTVFGRRLIAIGTNENAVRLAGVNTHGPKIIVFVITGFLAGLGALFYTARLGSSDPNAGAGMELLAIAAVVIGGTSLMGGRGTVINTFFGVLIIATLETGLAQLGASEPLKRVITGGVIIAAAVVDAWRHKLKGGPFAVLKALLRRPNAKGDSTPQA